MKIRFLLITIIVLGVIGFNIYVYYNKSLAPDTTLITNKINNEKITALVYGRDLCHYCILAKKLLTDRKINYEFIDLAENKDLYLKLVNQTQQKTVPFVFINNNFIGGYQDLEKFIDNKEND